MEGEFRLDAVAGADFFEEGGVVEEGEAFGLVEAVEGFVAEGDEEGALVAAGFVDEGLEGGGGLAADVAEGGFVALEDVGAEAVADGDGAGAAEAAEVGGGFAEGSVAAGEQEAGLGEGEGREAEEGGAGKEGAAGAAESDGDEEEQGDAGGEEEAVVEVEAGEVDGEEEGGAGGEDGEEDDGAARLAAEEVAGADEGGDGSTQDEEEEAGVGQVRQVGGAGVGRGIHAGGDLGEGAPEVGRGEEVAVAVARAPGGGLEEIGEEGDEEEGGRYEVDKAPLGEAAEAVRPGLAPDEKGGGEGQGQGGAEVADDVGPHEEELAETGEPPPAARPGGVGGSPLQGIEGRGHKKERQAVAAGIGAIADQPRVNRNEEGGDEARAGSGEAPGEEGGEGHGAEAGEEHGEAQRQFAQVAWGSVGQAGVEGVAEFGGEC